ncbi:MAG: PASTA domain-containing protein [Elusimicrobiota bacterium]
MFKFKLKKSKKYLKYGLLILSMVVVVGVISVILVNSLMNRVIHSRREVIVPDITEMPLKKALSELSEYNLSLMKIAEKYNSNIPDGSIITQSPPPGFMVKEGKPIEAVISTGGKTVFVPELEGKSLRQVELLLRQAGLDIGEQTRTYSNSVREGHIVAQDPRDGEVVQENSYVDIVVSKGPAKEKEVKKMPDLLGKDIREAEKIINDMNLKIESVNTKLVDDKSEGIVVKQSPEVDYTIVKDTEVVLTISRRESEKRVVRDEIIYYEVVQSGHPKDIKIEVEDDLSKRVVYEEEEISGGARLEIPVKVLGDTKVEIFEDGVLKKEDLLKEEESESLEEADSEEEIEQNDQEKIDEEIQKEEESRIEDMWDETEENSE